ncbi:hypothetical protein [Streptomyces sp. NBC_00690]|uniref:hypothetical protein n=1 Tax=Streptomyces sp. NBC_00690 TaxID=2975808 RepID=UPI002E2B13E3|nr:hypothetical protein [Streptomyces sp. NBC_00690]
MEPANFLSALDLGHLDDVQKDKVYGRNDHPTGLKCIWQDFLGLAPDRPARCIAPDFSRNTLPRLLKAIGVQQSTAHVRFGDAWKLQPHPLDRGHSREDRLSTHDGPGQEEGRVRIYLVGHMATETAKKLTDRAAGREY